LIWIKWGSFEIWKIQSLDDSARERPRLYGLDDTDQVRSACNAEAPWPSLQELRTSLPQLW
jgi:hypothetical protein